jgi:hypothetical protein
MTPTRLDLWTQDRVDLLLELWADGTSGTDIGRRLGCTKSAAVGKAWRLGLKPRAEASAVVVARARAKVVEKRRRARARVKARLASAQRRAAAETRRLLRKTTASQRRAAAETRRLLRKTTASQRRAAAETRRLLRKTTASQRRAAQAETRRLEAMIGLRIPAWARAAGMSHQNAYQLVKRGRVETVGAPGVRLIITDPKLFLVIRPASRALWTSGDLHRRAAKEISGLGPPRRDQLRQLA